MIAAANKVCFATLGTLLPLFFIPGCNPILSLVGSPCDAEHLCPPGYRCTNEVQGQCYPIACDGTACAIDEICVEGRCIETVCFGISCDKGERCANRRCWPEDCPQQECADGEVCEEDTCVPARCVEGRCNCTTEEVPGESCADEIDNDCDGFTDCGDSDCTFSQKPCGRCDLGTSICQEDKNWSECQDDTGCEPYSTQPCGERNCSTQTCQEDCSWGECPEVELVRVCQQCWYGECFDRLVENEDPSCCGPCPESLNSKDNCTEEEIGLRTGAYCDLCGDDRWCWYERTKKTEDCNCNWECP